MSNWTDGEVMIAAAKLVVEEYEKLKSGTQIDMAIFIDAADEVAKAYLAEHPADDDEPFTHEWLDSLFGLEEYICTKHDDNFDRSITWIETIGNVLIPLPKTRGDLRRLCKGLKIELKEKA